MIEKMWPLGQPLDFEHMHDKINELVDALNDLRGNPPHITPTTPTGKIESITYHYTCGGGTREYYCTCDPCICSVCRKIRSG